MDSLVDNGENGISCFSQLASLPAELLDLITRDIYGEDVMNLFLVGFQVLNRKLLNGGITELNCRFHGKSPRWRFQLARQLRKLRVFRLDCPHKLIKDFGWFAINALSPNLMVLDLNYFGALSLWSRVRQDSVAGTQVAIYSLSSRFPFLRYLRLFGQHWVGENVADPPGTISAYTQAYLPDQVMWQDFLVHLPLSLRTFDLQEYHPFTPAMTSLLPRKLTSLSLSNHFSSVLYLPKTLQSLSLIVDSYQILPSYLTGVPPGLTRLILFKLTHMDDSVFEALPRTLIHLILPLTSRGCSLNSIIARFPTLQTLEMPALCPNDSLLPSAFPASLTKLSLGNWPATKPFFDLMPRNLHWLQLGTQETLPINFAQFLPPRLQFLYLPKNNSITPSHQESLPKSLLIFEANNDLETQEKES